VAGEKQKAAQRARFKAAALAAMDVGKGYTATEGASGVLDGATDLAVAAATRATAAGRPLRPNERREVRQQVLGEQVGRQPGGQPQRRRPTVREWLERMTPEERASVEQTDTFARLSAKAQAHLLRVRDDVDEIDARAELLLAQQREDEWLAEQEDEHEGVEEDEGEGVFEERLADNLEREGEGGVFGAWSDETLTVAEALGLDEELDVEVEPSLSEQVGWEGDDE
jgi:hypothetical protein